MSDRRTNWSNRPMKGEMENKRFQFYFEKLYLNSESADVYFVCVDFDGKTERIPAHKLLLSTNSEGFKTMFSTSEIGQNEFKLDQISAAAFKEFLQFFYMAKIKLTVENIAIVIELAQDYGDDHLLFLCGVFLEQRLTTENITWGYSLALRFDRKKMKEHCERKICENASEMFKSTSFLNCNRDVLEQILKLNTLKCEEFQVLTGCLSWARASADRKGLDSKNTRILRDELGELLYQIRFRSMAMENFSMFVGSFGGFFAVDELEQIIQMIVAKDFTSSKFNTNLRNNGKAINKLNRDSSIGSIGSMECNPFLSYSSRVHLRPIEKIRFTTNNTVLLTGFVCSMVFNQGKDKVNLPTKITIIEGPMGESTDAAKLCVLEETLHSDREINVRLPSPVTIRGNWKYVIQLEQSGSKEYFFNEIIQVKKYKLKNGVEIHFIAGKDDSKFGLISKMYFKRAEN